MLDIRRVFKSSSAAAAEKVGYVTIVCDGLTTYGEEDRENSGRFSDILISRPCWLGD